MAIEFRCEYCGKRYSAPEQYAGKETKCHKCQRLIHVPIQTPEPPPEEVIILPEVVRKGRLVAWLIECECGGRVESSPGAEGEVGVCPKCKAAVELRMITRAPNVRKPPPPEKPKRKEKPPRPLSSIHSKIRGVTHRNRDGKSRQKIIQDCYEGEELTLVREPHNPHGNGNTIAIFRQNGDQLGYIGSELADELAPRMDKGSPVECRITEITGGGGWLSEKKNHGVNIVIQRYQLPRGAGIRR